MKVKLKDIFDLQMGKTPSRNNSEYWNGAYKWISIKDISNANKYIYDTKEKITAKAIEDSKIKSIPANTVIMSFKLSIGKTSITKEKIYTNEAIMAFIDKKTLPIDINYIYYLLSNWNWNIITNKAVMGLTLNKSILSNLEVDLPSIDEQKKIANTLDKVTNLIELRKKQLEKLDIFSKALFVEMFGSLEHNINYPYKKIVEFSNVISGGTPNRKEEDYWLNGTINWVKTTELKNTKINNSEEKISELGLENSSAKIVPKNTILIAMYGQGKTRGMTALLNIEASTNQACACILPSKNINYMYLWQYMILSYNQLRSMAKGGNQPNLNLDIIKNFKVLTPPIELQNQFAKKVEHIDKIKLSIQDSLTKLETLKKSLMQEYFS